MRLTRWLALVAICVGCGLLQVSLRHRMIAQGYGLGERLGRLEQSRTEVARLTVEVVGLESPVHLAQITRQRKLELVAWSALEDVDAGHRIPIQVAQRDISD